MKMQAWMDGPTKWALKLVGLFLFARLMLMITSTTDSLQGYGDFGSFYAWSLLPGWPYLNYWSEYPPVFPFLSEVLFRLAGGQAHLYTYFLIFILSLADAANLFLFTRLARRLWPEQPAFYRIIAYLILLLSLPYTWWYFDSLAILPMLLGLTYLLDQKPFKSGLFFGLGIAIKLFPVLGIVAAWRSMKWRKILLLASGAAAVVLIPYIVLGLVSPTFTLASLRTQGSKGAWDTVWALIDGFYGSGLFGPIYERLDPSTATILRGNPHQIPVWLTLLVFGALGFWALLHFKPTTERRQLALVGFAFSVFFLWSPGWSPQWVLYLLPLILLVFEERIGFLLLGSFVLINLLEWPMLLMRIGPTALSMTVPIRTTLLAFMAVLFYQQSVGEPNPDTTANLPLAPS